jgi:cysteinyl-tRNA synthetase
MIEQIEYVREIIESGYAYESNGSVYFDVEKYSEKYNYGEISGRKIEDLRSNTRDLKGQSEKKCPLDFVIWKKAEPKHTMQWNSPWGKGFPGWHLECSVMSTKYLGEEFDIHGGGMDLKFPHHECELAQNTACSGRTNSVKYWLHSNMLTLNGEKMSKSTGQFFLPEQIFNGTTELLEKPYSPMVVRFAMMQCHYRSTMDLSNDALSGAEKGLTRLKNGIEAIDNLIEGKESYFNIESIETSFKLAINDDFNTPVLVANLFDVIKQINLAIKENKFINKEDREALKGLFDDYLTKIMGIELKSKTTPLINSQTIEDDLIQLAVNVRNQAKNNKDWETSDLIRNKLSKLGVQLKDSKDGTQWSK